MRRLLLALLFLPSLSFAWITNKSVGELRATATAGNVNGIFFDSSYGGTDYTQQDTFQSSSTAWGSTNAISDPSLISISGAVYGDLAILGNTLHCSAGTNGIITSSGSWHTIVATDTASGGLWVKGPVGTAASAGTVTNQTCYIGGAGSLNSTLDQDMFAGGWGTNGVSAVKIWMKQGSFTLGESISSLQACGTIQNCGVEGYVTTRGDRAGMASINTGANSITFPANWDAVDLYIYGTPATLVSLGGSDRLINLKIRNNSTTASRVGINTLSNNLLFNIDAACIRGIAINIGSAPDLLAGLYLHDSQIGLRPGTGGTGASVENCIIANNYSAAIAYQGAVTSGYVYDSLLLYGAENQTGTGLSTVTGTTLGLPKVMNSIFYGFATPVNVADASTLSYDDYNVYSNNGNLGTNWTLGLHSSSTTIHFANVQQFTFTGCTSATNVLTCSGGGFNGKILDDQTFINITGGSGTGFATGMYPIHSHTDTTATAATPENSAINFTSSGSGSAIAGQFTYGLDFRVLPSTMVWDAGFPGLIGNTTAFMDIGIQHQDAPKGSAF